MLEVYDYDRNSLAVLTSRTTRLTVDEIRAKTQFVFILDRLEEMQVASIVVEGKYIDKDYLSDYTHFHARSFHSHERTCVRLHFFSKPLSVSSLASIITQKYDDHKTISRSFREAYLGFMVVRPLEQFIGKTCLRYNPPEDHQLPMSHTYAVGLYGVKLEVVNTVAFQEQDRIVAACATCAVWFALNAKNDEKMLPSPGAITRMAIKETHLRPFPNQGLDQEMITRALKHEQYEVFVQDCRPKKNDLNPSSQREVTSDTPDAQSNLYESTRNISDIRRVIYSHLRGGVAAPILGLGLYIKKNENVNEGEQAKGKESAYLGAPFARHAVTVLGYKINMEALYKIVSKKKHEHKNKAGSMTLMADAVDRFLVHDDQVGPFANLEVIDNTYARGKISTDNKGNSTLFLIDDIKACTNLWLEYEDKYLPKRIIKLKENDNDDVCLIPSLVSLATYHKIRVQYGEALQYIQALTTYLEPSNDMAAEEIYDPLGALLNNLVWDVYVVSTTIAKGEIRDLLCDTYRAIKESEHTGFLEEINKQIINVVSAYWPKYVWRATAYKITMNESKVIKRPIIDLVIDTTDILQSQSLLMPIFYDVKTKDTFKYLYSGEDYWVNISEHEMSIHKALAHHFKEPVKNSFCQADARFGFPMPPRVIKMHEYKTNEQVFDQRKIYDDSDDDVPKASSLKNDTGYCILLSHSIIKNSNEVSLKQKLLSYLGVSCGDPCADFWHDDHGASLLKLWVIDENCVIVLGCERTESDKKFGHPTLVGGAAARISGELHVLIDGNSISITINNASGRYCREKMGRDEHKLENARKYLEKCIKKLLGPEFIVTVEKNYIDLYGPEKISNASHVDHALTEVVDLIPSRGYRWVFDVIEGWVENIRNNINIDSENIIDIALAPFEGEKSNAPDYNLCGLILAAGLLRSAPGVWSDDRVFKVIEIFEGVCRHQASIAGSIKSRDVVEMLAVLFKQFELQSAQSDHSDGVKAFFAQPRRFFLEDDMKKYIDDDLERKLMRKI